MEIRISQVVILFRLVELEAIAKEYDIAPQELIEAMQSDLDQWVKENAKWVSKNKELA